MSELLDLKTLEELKIKIAENKDSITDDMLLNLLLGDTITYYPDVDTYKKLDKLKDSLGIQKEVTKTKIQKGMLARTIGGDLDELYLKLITEAKECKEKGDIDRLIELQHNICVGFGLMDLTPQVYDALCENENSLGNWFPPLKYSLDKINKENNNPYFKVPKTRIHRLPIELAQFIRNDYSECSKEDRELFNEYIFEVFNLEDGKEYFIKTGNFSSKFEFRNARCNEPREMGDYFIVINNFAQSLNASLSVDLVVRDWVENGENLPTIYNGMPLRTEFRCFVDFDENTIESIVPYWHPVVMKNALNFHLNKAPIPSIEKDLMTYKNEEDRLTRVFNENVSELRKNMKILISEMGKAGFKNRWSIDVMYESGQMYIIDMALTLESALSEYIVDYSKNGDDSKLTPKLNNIYKHSTRGLTEIPTISKYI